MRLVLALALLTACSLSREDKCKRFADRQVVCAHEMYGTAAEQQALQTEYEQIDYCMTSEYGFKIADHCYRAETCRELVHCSANVDPPKRQTE